jgi:hypothetical protein
VVISAAIEAEVATTDPVEQRVPASLGLEETGLSQVIRRPSC